MIKAKRFAHMLVFCLAANLIDESITAKSSDDESTGFVLLDFLPKTTVIPPAFVGKVQKVRATTTPRNLRYG
jgi:hypothetical protein